MTLTPIHLAQLPEQLHITQNEVHIWQIATSVNKQRFMSLKELLSKEEQGRADKFIFEKDQRRYTIARGSLRQLLAKYLGCNAQQLGFIQNENGKPFLRDNPTKIEFNVSHSHELILIAVMKETPVGIDIEHMRTDIDAEAIAERFFSKQEALALTQTAAEYKLKYFFELWTKKEAVTKMQGTGIYKVLDNDISVNFKDCAIVSLAPAAGYSAALAMEKEISNIAYYHI